MKVLLYPNALRCARDMNSKFVCIVVYANRISAEWDVLVSSVLRVVHITTLKYHAVKPTDYNKEPLNWHLVFKSFSWHCRKVFGRWVFCTPSQNVMMENHHATFVMNVYYYYYYSIAALITWQVTNLCLNLF